jgi:glucosamine--fructose-6-phosphate aminotransferase (isomerizing)|tara:strand:- start:297 stop:2129 length:1833 start_codon:yes stop_codon:yes gene_type:complete
MCGIVGNITDKPIKNMLMNGLAELEYRGYDSVGLATIGSNNKISIIKNKGKIKDFTNKYKNKSLKGNLGIGHTRWATHGIPSEINAHPIYNSDKNLAVVHNGIIENYIDIKNDLIKEGFEFFTDTDTECIANLISSFLKKDFNMIDSITKTSERILGHAAVLVISEDFPSTIFGFKKGFAGSILISKNNGEISISSDLQALSFDSGEYIVLEDNEIFSAKRNNVEIYSEQKMVSKEWKKIDEKSELVTKGKYKYFMEKEIYEQPKVFLDNFSGRIDFVNKSVSFKDEIDNLDLGKFKRIHLIGMGSSYNACLLASYWIEKVAKIPTVCSNSSEFRYREPIIEDGTLIIPVSQSGETADTLSASHLMKQNGYDQLSIVNTKNTELERITSNSIYMRANKEIGVASTKTFMSTLQILFTLALHLAENSNPKLINNKLLDDFKNLPTYMNNIFQNSKLIKQIAKKYSEYSNFLYLGRGYNYPIAMEGALKLKELSYVHAEGYPAGEMKHGPISLIEDKMPVFAIITDGVYLNKMISNIREIGSRDGNIIVLTNCSDKLDKSWYSDLINFDHTPDIFSPFLSTICIQLFSIYIAMERNLDVDQPRNLAKSVTVE